MTGDQEDIMEEILGALNAAAGPGAAIGAHVARGAVTDALTLCNGDALPVMAAHAVLEVVIEFHAANGGDPEQLADALAQVLTHRAAAAADF